MSALVASNIAEDHEPVRADDFVANGEVILNLPPGKAELVQADTNSIHEGQTLHVEGIVLKFLSRSQKTEDKPIQEGDTVLVNYVGRVLPTKREFDRNLAGYPFAFTIGEAKVVKGFESAVRHMQVGDKVLAKLDPEYGYGSEGSGHDIPANARLEFEIELVGIKQRIKGSSTAADRERLEAIRADREAAEMAFKEKREQAKAKAEQTKAAMAEKLAKKNKKGNKGGGGKKSWVAPAEKNKATKK